MAKYDEPFQETSDLFNKKIKESDNLSNVNITILVDAVAKKITDVSKAPPKWQHITKCDVLVVINEKIFDKLSDEAREIVVDEALAGIFYDSEKDTVVVNQPDVKTFKSIFKKHTFDNWVVVEETITSLYLEEKKLEDEKKAATAKAKKKNF